MTIGRFGRYELESLLGRGGMGEVYRALDTEQRRHVALKVLPESAAGDALFVERFRKEAHSAARLRGPHILPIHGFGDIDGRLYIDMRLVDGRDLAKVLTEDGVFPGARAASVIDQVAEALDEAHAANLVHRDVKPSNVLLTDRDFAYLFDFGIARSGGTSTTGGALTATGTTIGTLTYMAPERFVDPRSVDGRADVYSLTCLLFELLTGRCPFPADDFPALLHAHLNVPPPAVSPLRPDLNGAWDAVVARGMAKRPADRPASAGALAADVRRAMAGAPVTAGSAGHRPVAAPTLRAVPPTRQAPASAWATPDPARRPSSSVRPAVAVLLGIVAVAAAVGVTLLLTGRTETQVGEPARSATPATVALPAPTTAPTSSVIDIGPAAVPDSYAGTWRGEVTQTGARDSRYSVVIVVQSGYASTSVSYPELNCSGRQDYLGPSSGGGISLVEVITSGTQNCTDSVPVRLRLRTDGAMDYSFSDVSGSSGRAVLTRG